MTTVPDILTPASAVDTTVPGAARSAKKGAKNFIALFSATLDQKKRLPTATVATQTVLTEKSDKAHLSRDDKPDEAQTTGLVAADLAALTSGKPLPEKAKDPAESTPALASAQSDNPAINTLMAMLPHQMESHLAPPSKADPAVKTPVAVASLSPTAPKELALTKPGDKIASAAGNDTRPTPAAPALEQATPFISEVVHSPVAHKQAVTIGPDTTPTLPAQAPAPTAFSAPAQTGQVQVPSTPLLNAQLGSPEWQQSLGQQISLLSRQGSSSAELRLHPEDLGQLQIHLKIDDNNVAQIQLVSPHSHVRAAIEAALPTLRTSLAETGIELGQSSVSSGQTGSGAFSQQQQSSSSRIQWVAPESDALGSAAAVPVGLTRLARGDGAIDTFA